jgi:hypothetical protein
MWPIRKARDSMSDPRSQSISQSPLARLAGPSAITAGVLMVGAQLAMLPFDPREHVATSQSPVFQIGGVAYLLGFVALLVAAVATYLRQHTRAGRFGLVAVLTAIAGTMLLGGDLWFETFAVPWLADQAPGALDTEPTTLLAIGAISSYLLFAIGWVLYGIATLRARVFPRSLAIALVAGGVIGFNALLAPFGIPLGVTVAALGAWIVRNSQASRAPAAPGEPAQRILQSQHC